MWLFNKVLKHKKALLCTGAILAAIPCLANGTFRKYGELQETAQRPEARRVFGISLLDVPVPVLEANLKLTAEQKTDIAAIQSKYATESLPFLPAVSVPLSAVNGQKLQELHKQAIANIETVLHPEQRTKTVEMFKQLRLLRLVDIPPLTLPELKLTLEQARKLMDIAGELREKSRSLTNFSLEERREQMRQVQQLDRIRAWELLTESQKAILKEKRGKTAQDNSA